MSVNTDSPTTYVPSWTFGDRIRKVRREAGMTVTEFAAAVGLSRAAVGSLETDRMRSSDPVALAKRIQLLTGVPAAWLLGVYDEAGPGPDGPGPAEECTPRDSNPEPAGYGSVLRFVSRDAPATLAA